MRIEKFNAAIAEATIRPKAVKASPDFLGYLKNRQLIQMKQTAICGIWFRSDSPFYDGDIWVICSPELLTSGDDFELPPSSKSAPNQ